MHQDVTPTKFALGVLWSKTMSQLPEDYDIPFAPHCFTPEGEVWITAENPVKVRR